MKIIIFLIILLFIIGCSTIPEEYQREPTKSELIYMEGSALWGIGMTLVTAYTIYYLDNEMEWF